MRLAAIGRYGAIISIPSRRNSSSSRSLSARSQDQGALLDRPKFNAVSFSPGTTVLAQRMPSAPQWRVPPLPLLGAGSAELGDAGWREKFTPLS